MAPAMTKTEVFEIVRTNILEVLPELQPGAIRMDQSLSDLGANSVDRMEVVTLSMQALKVKIPLMSFAGVSNIDGLVDVLCAHLR
jgi:polyketide biosynthesis acyl carrier protein